MTNIDQLDTRLRQVEIHIAEIKTDLKISAWVFGIAFSSFIAGITFLLIR